MLQAVSSNLKLLDSVSALTVGLVLVSLACLTNHIKQESESQLF